MLNFSQLDSSASESLENSNIGRLDNLKLDDFQIDIVNDNLVKLIDDDFATLDSEKKISIDYDPEKIKLNLDKIFLINSFTISISRYLNRNFIRSSISERNIIKLKIKFINQFLLTNREECCPISMEEIINLKFNEIAILFIGRNFELNSLAVYTILT